MTTVLITPETLDRMHPDELEAYLQGSGKPPSSPFSVQANKYSWGIHYVPSQQSPRDPKSPYSTHRKYNLPHAPHRNRRALLKKMKTWPKARIVRWLYDHFDYTPLYPQRITKDKLLRIATKI